MERLSDPHPDSGRDERGPSAIPSGVFLKAAVTALFIVSSAFLGARIAQASADDDQICGFNPANNLNPVPIEGTVKALLILARFADELDVGTSCSPDPWPADSTNVPAWADSLLEWTAPYHAGSMTHFFDLMSGGKHHLEGRVFPRVITLDSLHYFGCGSGIAGANAAVIDSVDASADSAFADYDYDHDHHIDFVFIVYRQRFCGSCGCSLAASDGDGQLFLPGNWRAVDGGADSVETNYGGILCPRTVHRGPVITRAGLVHEYGHHLLDAFCEKDSVLGGSQSHLRTIGPYGIMDGTAAFDTPSGFMETVLRWKLGWIAPADTVVLATPGQDTTVALTDVGANGGDGFIVVKTADPKQWFLLEARDSSATVYTDGTILGGGTCDSHPGHSGLLIEHISDHHRMKTYTESFCCDPREEFVEGWWETGTDSTATHPPVCPTTSHCVNNCAFEVCCPNAAYPPFVDVEAATGIVDTTFAPNPVFGFDAMSCDTCENNPHQGEASDFFGNGQANTFTPFTNPNTNLYWFPADSADYDDPDSCSMRRQQSMYSGLSFYNIHWTTPPGSGGAGVMSVTIRYDGTSPGSAFAAPDSMDWQGRIQIMGDVDVPDGHLLTIEPGTKVFTAANHDAVGGDGRTTLKVEGRLAAEGTVGSPIDFTSSRDTDFTGFWGSGQYGHAAADSDWSGLTFNMAGAYCPGYGYERLYQPLSSLKDAAVKNAAAGITMVGQCAPSIQGVTFSNIKAHRDIFLMSDTIIPNFYSFSGICWDTTNVTTFGWDLGGGTHVVASTHTFNDAWIGEADKNDLIVFGKLFTDGSSSAGDSVYFEPEEVTDVTDPEAGADWGGVMIAAPSAGSHLRYADLGYAANPLYMYYADSTTSLENSRVHHFADTGIWVDGVMGHGLLIDNCIVDRGGTLNDALGGLTGIFLDQTDSLTVSDTIVDLVGRSSSDGGTGISIHYGSTFCASSPAVHRTLTLLNNTIVGPGRDILTGTSYTGLLADWVCGSDYRDIDILRNMVAGFKFAAVDFEETSDVQANCNFLWSNQRGVDIYRDGAPTGTSIRFKEDKIEATEPDSSLFALRTTDALHVKLGPYQTDRGHSRLKVNKDKTRFIFENDSNSGHGLDASNNFWYADTLLADSTLIKSRLRPTGYSIKIDDFGTDDTSPPANCWPDTTLATSLLGGSSPRRIPIIANESEPSAAPDPDAPTVLELGKPFPNPNRTGAAVSLAVPATRIGTFVAQVFDVRGRRVWEAREEIASAGRYRVVWAGRDSLNQSVAAGVYFLRLSGPGGFTKTRKITLLR